MFKLINLEIKRNNLKPYFYAILFIFAFTFCIGTLFSAIPKIEGDYNSTFSNENNLLIMITIISMSGFLILCSVMYGKFIIDKYVGRKNILLFTYPQKRSDIFIAKFIFINIFIFLFVIISNILDLLFINLVINITNITKIKFNLSNVCFITIIFALITNLISLIPLTIGFLKKSNILALVSTIILITPFSNSLLLFKDFSFINILLLIIILMIISITLLLILLKRVNEMECL